MRGMRLVKLRSAATRLGRNRRFPRRLPAELGGAFFYASTEGGLKYLRRDAASIDRDLTDAARTYVRPGATVWDIGANLGLFTFTAAGLAGATGRVLAVEPDAWLVQGLRASARRNGGSCAAVDVLPMAVASGGGISRFLISAQSRASNSLDGHGNYHMDRQGARETQLVPTTSLDALLGDFAAPDVVKIDVEHAEVDALLGAAKLLASVRPIILVEVAPSNQDAATDLLIEAGYRFIDGETGAESTRATWSTVAIPK